MSVKQRKKKLNEFKQLLNSYPGSSGEEEDFLNDFDDDSFVLLLRVLKLHNYVLPYSL